MSLITAILLGIIQGLTEFLPISSSGHLVVAPWALGLGTPTAAFATALHLGTLLGIVAALRIEVTTVVRAVVGWSSARDTEKGLVRLLVLGSIPAAIAGASATLFIDEAFETPVLVGFMLIVTGFIMSTTERRANEADRPPKREALVKRDAWTIGAAQAFAIIPGISRSGATIAAGIRLGLTREAAARFSFLLAVPAIAGATLVQLPKLADEGAFGSELIPFALGLGLAAFTGWWSLRWFLGIIGRAGLAPFARYCWFAGAATLFIAMARG